jgi:hypothetical protein
MQDARAPMRTRQAHMLGCAVATLILCSMAILATSQKQTHPHPGVGVTQQGRVEGGWHGSTHSTSSDGLPDTTSVKLPVRPRSNASRHLHRSRLAAGEGVSAWSLDPQGSAAPSQDTALKSLLAAYAERHRGATSQPGYAGKYVLVGDAPSNGLGNRLPGFIAGLFLALATDRVLMCKWPELEPYFESPEGLDFDWTRQLERYEKWQLPEPSRQVDSIDNYTLWLQVWTSLRTPEPEQIFVLR